MKGKKTLSWKSFLLDGLQMKIYKLRMALFPKQFAFELTEQNFKQVSILQSIRKLYLDTKQWMLDTIKLKVSKIKLWYQGLEIMNYIRENIIK